MFSKQEVLKNLDPMTYNYCKAYGIARSLLHFLQQIGFVERKNGIILKKPMNMLKDKNSQT